MMKDLLGCEVMDNPGVDREHFALILQKQLLGMSCNELAGLMYSKVEAAVDFVRLCEGYKGGNKISLLFNPHRLATRANNRPSIIDGLASPGYFDGLARAIMFKVNEKDTLYSAIQIGINSTQYVNEFPPYVARLFYQNMGARVILDPCAGWGGRMIGAASLGAFYHGFEPASQTYNGLLELGEFLRGFGTGFDYKIECLPYEEAELNRNYDMALTSPPYYDTEIYSSENTNSCNRYKTFNDWVDGFYRPMVKKTMLHTNKFILNIGTRRYDLLTPIQDYKPREISSPLSGGGGLRHGKGESFYYIGKKG